MSGRAVSGGQAPGGPSDAARIVVWRAHDGSSLEHVSVTPHAAGISVRSRLIGVREGAPVCAAYRLELGVEWQVRRLRASWREAGGVCRVLLARDAQGTWRENGRPRADLATCSDVDIAWTPLTNTLPIRRLGLAIGAARPLIAAYLAPPQLDLVPDAQRYTRLAEHRWQYESLDSDFIATITVDHDGLVIDYPPLFHRIAPATLSP